MVNKHMSVVELSYNLFLTYIYIYQNLLIINTAVLKRYDVTNDLKVLMQEQFLMSLGGSIVDSDFPLGGTVKPLSTDTRV